MGSLQAVVLLSALFFLFRSCCGSLGDTGFRAYKPTGFRCFCSCFSALSFSPHATCFCSVLAILAAASSPLCLFPDLVLYLDSTISEYSSTASSSSPAQRFLESDNNLRRRRFLVALCHTVSLTSLSSSDLLGSISPHYIGLYEYSNQGPQMPPANQK